MYFVAICGFMFASVLMFIAIDKRSSMALSCSLTIIIGMMIIILLKNKGLL